MRSEESSGVRRWRALSIAILLLCTTAAGAAQAPARSVPAPAAQEIATSLFLIGDAGHADRPDHPVVSAVRDAASPNPARSLILFLGDNAYPQGLPDKDAPGRAAAELRLNTQVDAARASGAATIFVPGNHDWAEMRSEGWDQVRREAAYVVERGGPTVRFLPEDGCPGPVTVDVGPSVRLVLLDTQWWLHKHAKPVHPTSTCAADSEGEVLGSLRAALRGAAGRHVFVVGHHPLATGGPHGGHFPVMDHLFPLREFKKWLWLPLPVIGSAYPLARQNGISPQDLSSGAYRHMRDSLESVFRDTPPLAYPGRPRPRVAGALRGRRPPHARQRLGELRPQQRRQEARQHALRLGQAGLHAGGCSRGRARAPRRARRRRRGPRDRSIRHVARLTRPGSRFVDSSSRGRSATRQLQP